MFVEPSGDVLRWSFDAGVGHLFTEEQLAHMIGVQRNAISIVAHALQQAGVLRYSRGQIEITDVEALRKTTCECYHAVHARQAHLFK